MNDAQREQELDRMNETLRTLEKLAERDADTRHQLREAIRIVGKEISKLL